LKNNEVLTCNTFYGLFDVTRFLVACAFDVDKSWHYENRQNHLREVVLGRWKGEWDVEGNV